MIQRLVAVGKKCESVRLCDLVGGSGCAGLTITTKNSVNF